jgi:hypothetical protein
MLTGSIETLFKKGQLESRMTCGGIPSNQCCLFPTFAKATSKVQWRTDGMSARGPESSANSMNEVPTFPTEASSVNTAVSGPVAP